MSYPTYTTQLGNDLLDDLETEISKARAKFPSNEHMMAALTEEVGELAQALIDHSRGKATIDEVRKEAIQVMCVAVRIHQEGDASFWYVGSAPWRMNTPPENHPYQFAAPPPDKEQRSIREKALSDAIASILNVPPGCVASDAQIHMARRVELLKMEQL